jgi:uncharacterized membrane protein
MRAAPAAEPAGRSVAEQLLEVVLVGSVAGVGLAIAFSLLVRGLTQAGNARRGQPTGGFLRNVALAVASGAVCVGALVFAVLELVSG